MEPELKKCRACGTAYPEDVPVCPRCRVPRKGDVNRPAVLAYSIFLLLMVIAGGLAFYWLQRTR